MSEIDLKVSQTKDKIDEQLRRLEVAERAEMVKDRAKVLKQERMAVSGHREYHGLPQGEDVEADDMNIGDTSIVINEYKGDTTAAPAVAKKGISGLAAGALAAAGMVTGGAVPIAYIGANLLIDKLTQTSLPAPTVDEDTKYMIEIVE